jgi:hypothetical protein
MKQLGSLALASLLIAGCAEIKESPDYSPPEASGLIGVRAYPTADDICMVIGENDLTVEFLDDSALLIGCPQHEMGAIADREAEGAERLTQIGDWVLLSVPLR